MNAIKRRLLEAYKKMYKDDPKEYKGAVKISNQVGLTEKEHGSHHGTAHNYLKQLLKEGYLEQKRNLGFRFKCCNKMESTNDKAKIIKRINNFADRFIDIEDQAKELKKEMNNLQNEIKDLHDELRSYLHELKGGL